MQIIEIVNTEWTKKKLVAANTRVTAKKWLINVHFMKLLVKKIICFTYRINEHEKMNRKMSKRYKEK